MTKHCQYQNPSDFGHYHTCANCERILKIFEIVIWIDVLLLCLAYLFSNADLL